MYDGVITVSANKTNIKKTYSNLLIPTWSIWIYTSESLKNSLMNHQVTEKPTALMLYNSMNVHWTHLFMLNGHWIL